jgi:hypothetical protein
MDEIEIRMRDFKQMTHFDSPPVLARRGAPLGVV